MIQRIIIKQSLLKKITIQDNKQVRLFQAVTLSPVMLVEIENPVMVLKLFDRRVVQNCVMRSVMTGMKMLKMNTKKLISSNRKVNILHGQVIQDGLYHNMRRDYMIDVVGCTNRNTGFMIYFLGLT